MLLLLSMRDSDPTCIIPTSRGRTPRFSISLRTAVIAFQRASDAASGRLGDCVAGGVRQGAVKEHESEVGSLAQRLAS